MKAQVHNFFFIALQLLILCVFCQCHFYNKKNMKYNFDFYTQYNQFYIADKFSKADTGSEDFWNNTAYNERLAILGNTLGIRIQSYGHVKGEIIILEKASEEVNHKFFDHIVEGGIDVNSGLLEILDCPNSNLELEIKLNPQRYRFRIYSSNLSSVIDDDGDDYYKIEIWPDNDMERKVLKLYNSH